MSKRKRWSVTVWPGAQTTQFPSEREAYEAVKRIKDWRESDMTRTNQITVKVSEAGSEQWQTYERFRWSDGEWTT